MAEPPAPMDAPARAACRRAFPVGHPAIVALTTVCVLACIVDVALILATSVVAGPWEVLSEPIDSLEAVQRFDASVLRDEVMAVVLGTSHEDLEVAAEDAAEAWEALRDDAVAQGLVDDPAPFEQWSDLAAARLDPEVPAEVLPTPWRQLLWVLNLSPWLFAAAGVACAVALCTIGRATRASRLSVPVPDAAAGTVAALLAMGSLSAWTLVLGVGLAILPEAWPLAEALSSGALLLWVPPTLLLLWLCAARGNGGLVRALGAADGCTPRTAATCVAALLVLFGAQELLLSAIGAALPDQFVGGAWWESFDEVIVFGPAWLAALDSLDALVGAPVVEEVIFRGLLFGGLLCALGFVPAAILSSLAFAAVHGYGLDGTLAVLVTGSLLCWVYWWTGRLWVAILAHATHNALVLIPLWATRALVEGG